MNKTPNKNYNNETSPIPAVKHRQLTNSYQRLETSIGKSGDRVLYSEANLKDFRVGENTEELANAITEEKRKRLILENQLEGLKLDKKEDNDTLQLKEKITIVERQLETEKRRGDGILRDIENLKTKNTIGDKFVLEKKADALQKDIEYLRDENARLRMSKKNNESSKLSELLKDYEERIENEIQEKYKMLRDKQKEIQNLRDTIPKLKMTINEIESEKDKLEDYYKDEIRKHKLTIDDYNARIAQEKDAKSRLIEIHNDNSIRGSDLRQGLTEALVKKDNLDKDIEGLKNDIDQINYQALNRQAELEQEITAYENLQDKLRIKEKDIEILKEDCSRKKAQYADEIARLKRQIMNVMYDNEELENRISVKQIEIDTLNKDAIAWKQVSGNVSSENEALKRIIERLEDRTRSLSSVTNINFNTTGSWNSHGIEPNPVQDFHNNGNLPTYSHRENEQDEGKSLEENSKIADPYSEQNYGNIHDSAYKQNSDRRVLLYKSIPQNVIKIVIYREDSVMK